MSQQEMAFAARLINKITWRLVGKTGITYDDLPDLQQDLWLDLLERHPDYRPELGNIRAFTTRVVKNKVASILKTRAARKRGKGRPCLSLDKEFEDDDGELTEFHETISADDYLRRTRGPVRTEEERGDLALDVRKVISQLQPHERVVCLLLIDRDVSNVSGVIGIPRSTLRDLIRQLRQNGKDAGLEKYFE